MRSFVASVAVIVVGGVAGPAHALALESADSSSSSAEPVPREVRADVEAPPRNWLNLRGGFGAQPVDAVGARPQICAEVSPLDFLGVEACGTGAGFLFESGSELAHFRGKLRLTSLPTEVGHFSPHLALGFAELQVGDDGPGFDFFGTGATGVETAGPEAGASVRWAYPLPYDFEVLADATVGLAWLPYAPQLSTSMSPWQPSATVTVGVGW